VKDMDNYAHLSGA